MGPFGSEFSDTEDEPEQIDTPEPKAAIDTARKAPPAIDTARAPGAEGGGAACQSNRCLFPAFAGGRTSAAGWMIRRGCACAAKPRQVGLSTAVAAEALHAAVYGETTVIVSASQRQAAELLRKAVQLAPLVKSAGAGALRIVRESAEIIELSTGGRVISLPASAATVQGFAGHVVIDEAAWIPTSTRCGWRSCPPSRPAASSGSASSRRPGRAADASTRCGTTTTALVAAPHHHPRRDGRRARARHRRAARRGSG
ncbi:MAG: terminase family protein [Phycisphaerae bacterium]